MNDVKPSKKDIEDNKFIALLSYISILCFVPLLLKKDSPFAQFHAKQGLSLFIVEVGAGLLSWTIILAPLSSLVFVASFLVSLYGIYLVWNGKVEAIPVLKNIAEKLNI